MTAAAAAAATATFLHAPSYCSFHPPAMLPHRYVLLYHNCIFGFPPARRLDVRVSSLGKSRKKKSDSELCEEIREFLVSAGLPEGHVPTIKELSEHGRNDLANLVRRRGYKVIKGLLLVNRVETYDGTNNLAENKEDRSCQEEIVKGYVEEDCSGKTGVDLPGDMVFSSRDQTVSAIKPSFKDEAPNERADEIGIMLPFGAIDKEANAGSLNKDMVHPFSHASRVPEEVSSDKALKGSVEIGSPFQSERMDLSPYSSPALTGISFVPENFSSHSKNHSASDGEISSREDGGSSVKSSLDEMVAKFMQSGYLDPVEDCLPNLLSDNWEKENKTTPVQKNGPECVMDGELKTPVKEPPQHMSSEGLMELDRINAREQKIDDETFDGKMKSEGVEESPWQEKQSDIKHLKLMLHQKELELSQLKEQIQKETNALELMQIKAENEISKAQKRQWENDAELQAAEDSLAGLKEVPIEYQGEGYTVEVAGSFNGWQTRMTMDPQPSDLSTDYVGSRRPSLWSTTLWLYPGKYEIKFVIDGHWKIDPQKESVTWGSISNNILRVER